MAKIKVHAGDFLKQNGSYSFGQITLYTSAHPFKGENFPLNYIQEIEVASEESVKRVGGTIGWGAAGALVLGPVGLLAGLLLGGKGKDVTFVAKFRDGRKVLATTDSKTYIQLQAANFK